MRRVKYFKTNKSPISGQLKKSEKVIECYESQQLPYDINDIIELHNVTLYIENDLFLDSWSEVYRIKLQRLVPEFNKRIAIFFKNIRSENFISTLTKLEGYYKRDFIILYNKFGLHNIINEGVIRLAVQDHLLPLDMLVEEKKFVKDHDLLIRDLIISNPKNAELILKKYVVKRDIRSRNQEPNLPQSLSSEDVVTLLEEYIESDYSLTDYVRLISTAQKQEEFEVPDLIKYKAIKTLRIKEQELLVKKEGVQFQFEVGFKDQISLINEEVQFNSFKKTYSFEWFERNLDYPTILQNYIYLFKFVDKQMRISLVSKESELSIFETTLGIKSKKEYIKGISFNTKETVSNIETAIYYDFLYGKAVRMEEIAEWFFSDYLKDEFEVDNFYVSLPSDFTNSREKCTGLLPELESILKQFTHQVKFGEIDHEFIEISTKPIKYKQIPSFFDRKYVYANREKLNTILYYFFSDQTLVGYLPDRGIEENTLFDLVSKNKVNYSYIEPSERFMVDYLIGDSYLKVNEEGTLEFPNETLIAILYDLYTNEVISYYNVPKILKDEIDKMASADLVIFGSSLLSIPEQNYFNYYLNKSEFDNGPELRNKYSHGTPSNNHKENYIVLVKLLILLIIKVNDEFCIKKELESF